MVHMSRDKARMVPQYMSHFSTNNKRMNVVIINLNISRMITGNI